MVALLGLLSSVITVIQLMITVAIFVKYKMPRTEKERRRLSVGVGLVSIASVVVVSALTWSGVLAAAAKIGDGGVNGVFYALIVPLLGFGMALMLLTDIAQKDRRLYRLATCIVIGSISLMIGIDLSVRNVGWGVYLLLAAELGLVCAALVSHFAIDRGKDKDSRVSRQPRASDETSHRSDAERL